MNIKAIWPQVLLFLFILSAPEEGLTQGQMLIPFLQVDKKIYGYADLQGQIIVEPQFDEVAWQDSVGFADVRIGNHWSKIDPKGRILLPFESLHPVRLLPVFAIEFTRPSFDNPPEHTLDFLRAVEIDSGHFRVIHLGNGRYTQAFSNTTQMYWDKTLHVTFSNGVLVGMINDSLFNVVDITLKELLTTENVTTMLNDHLIGLRENNRAALFDYHTLKKTPLPFYEVRQIVNDSFLVVCDTTSTLRNINMFDKTLKGVSDLNGRIILPLKHLSLSYYMGNLFVEFIHQKGSRFIDLTGSPIDTNIYPGMNFQCDSIYLVHRSDKKMQILDVDGKALSTAYDKINQGPNCKSFTYRDGSYSGMLDSTFQEIFRYEADEIDIWYTSELIWIKRNDKYGVVKWDKEIILPPIYDHCSMPNNTYLYVTLNGKKGLYRKDGSVIFEPIYQDIDNIGANGKSYFATKLHDLFTLYDDQFQVLDDSLYKAVIDRKVSIERTRGMTYLKDPYGHDIVPPTTKYTGGYVYADSSWLHLVWRSDHIDIINSRGKVITNDSILLSLDNNKRCTWTGMFGVRVGKNEGVIDHLGNWIISPAKQEIMAVTEGLIIVRKKGKVLCFSTRGVPLNSGYYDEISIDKREKYWRVELDGKYGFINSLTGQLILPVIYDHVSDFDDFLAVAVAGKINGSKYAALIDTSDNEVFNIKCDTMYAVDEIESNRCYFASVDGKMGVVDVSGQVVIPFQYANLSAYADSTFFMTTNETAGLQLINRHNRIVFSGKDFPGINYIRLPGDHFLLPMNGYSVIVDSDGSVVKTIQGAKVNRTMVIGKEHQFLESTIDGNKYLINAETFVEYKSN